MPAAKLTLYELAGADPDLRFSPHCWKTRMALAHKGLDAECMPWRFTETDRIASSGQGRVPVLVDDRTVIADSWQIALHLEQRFPDRPSLFGTADAIPLTHFINVWADATLIPALARIILVDVFDCIDEKDKTYFRRSREDRYGMLLEAVVADRQAKLAEFGRALLPLRLILKDHDFVAGAAPAYSDYCIFGVFMWARCTSLVDLLEPDDPVLFWRERLLDLFDGLARRARSVQR
ncbi:MAG: glutathione S-transferase N-terminal domain-containing protein [Beijerinckiaceae bacterium]